MHVTLTRYIVRMLRKISYSFDILLIFLSILSLRTTYWYYCCYYDDCVFCVNNHMEDKFKHANIFSRYYVSWMISINTLKFAHESLCFNIVAWLILSDLYDRHSEPLLLSFLSPLSLEMKLRNLLFIKLLTFKLYFTYTGLW